MGQTMPREIKICGPQPGEPRPASDVPPFPGFTCAACGCRLGGEHRPETGWQPSPCPRCRARASAKDAAQRRKLGRVAAGVDIDKAVAAYRRLPPFAGNLQLLKTVTVGHRAETRYSGYGSRRRLRVAFGPSATKAEVLEVLAHELCHASLPGRVQAHGERFRLTLRRAARELWGIEVPLLKPSERGIHKNAAYAMDHLIMVELEKKIAAGEVETFPHEPKAQPSRQARTLALVEKRAAHAFKMLARAEKRAQSAQRTLSKWRQKARYYERVAAKRGDGSNGSS